MDKFPIDAGKGAGGKNAKEKEHKRIRQEKLDSHHKARRNTRHNTEEKKYANLDAGVTAPLSFPLSSNDVLEILRGFHWHAQQTPQDPMELINQLRPSSEEDLTAGDSNEITWHLKINKLLFKSSSGDLNEDEKRLREVMLVGRIEQDKREKRALTHKLDNLRKEYTTAVHIVYTSMYVAFQIYHLVQLGKEVYEDNPEVLARFADKPLVEIAKHVAEDINARTGRIEYQDKYDRWVNHYKHNLGFTSSSHKLEVYPNSHLPRVIVDDTGKYIPLPLVPPPPLGPIEIYNGRRSHLMREIVAHNCTNEKYNENYPHLNDNFKLGTFDVEGKLTPDIPHLPSLEGALKKEIWKTYEEIFRLCPVEIPEDIKNIGEAFSQGPVEWGWNYIYEKYELQPISDNLSKK